ncbi:MAG: FHA domain-containing protein, partial [Candidatus Binatia bacterium]|nr:FHA domain-containing protein [Candidatus Binatia bacterium]
MLKVTVLSGPDAGATFQLSGETAVIGRSHTCDVVLADTLVSKRHCTITYQDGHYILTDHSTNGTFLQDLKTRLQKQELHDGDELLLGKTRLRVEFLPEGDVAPRPSGETQTRVVAPTREIQDATASLTAVRQPDVPIVITVLDGPDRGLAYSPAQDVISIGRATTCDIVLHDPTVSRLHATIKREAGKYRLYDENSKTGIYLRTPTTRVFHADLADGDVVYLGQTQLRIDIPLSAVKAGEEDATVISGNLAGKDFTFTLAVPLPSARRGKKEATTPDLAVETVAEQEEVTKVSPALPAAPRITLRVVEGPDAGATFTPPPGTNSFVVGRGGSADFRLQDRGASRAHFSIEATPNGFVLTDTDSLNGTFINQGTDRVRSVTLKNGDEIRVSETRIQVEISLPEDVTVVTAPLSPSVPVVAEAAAEQPRETPSDSHPAAEAVQSRSAAFKERLATIAKHKGISLRPFTMPGTPRQWAALGLMLFAVISCYAFLLAGRTEPFSAGPVAAGHAQWESACTTCHPAWGVQPINATCVTAECHASVLQKGKEHVRFDPVRAQLRDDCVSCHIEHRGRSFDLAGGAEACWSCHREGLQQTRLYHQRPLQMYYDTVFRPAKASSTRLQLSPSRPSPEIEQQRQTLLQQVGARETGLVYAHGKHEQDVLDKYGRVEDCTACHALATPGERGQASQVEWLLAFPTHAQCMGCHEHRDAVGDANPDIAKTKASPQCLQCHTSQTGGVVRIQRAITYVNFTHQTHTRVAGACRSCHAVVLHELAYRPVVRTAAL